jgi:ribonuclease J
MKNNFKITCLGGCGHIGSNMFLFEDEQDSFYIDCGISFPNMDFLDINYETPDPEYWPECENLVLTHGHEDHIGAIPLLFKKRKLNIWCTRFVKQLLRTKLSECSNKNVQLYSSTQEIKIGKFTITPFQVDHSIPETNGILIQHEETLIDIVYISDFKIGTTTKPKWFKFLDGKLRDKSQKLFMLDSTNIRKLQSGIQLESQIQDEIINTLKLYKKRIFLALFSSNVERLGIFIDAARKAGRKVLLHGRSVKNYYAAALEADILKHDDQLVFDDHKPIFNDNMLVICTGSQGEPRASMNRIARGEDKVFKLDAKTDLVIFSSMSIPGNEEKIQNLKNIISEKDILILDNRNSKIHVSGHASRDDLEMIYRHFKPHMTMPIHGESHFLLDHRQFIEDLELGLKTVEVLTGDKFLVNNEGYITKQTNHPQYQSKLFNSSRYSVSDETVSERKKLAKDGVISITVDKKRKTQFQTVGLALPENNTEKFEKMIQKVMQEKLTNELKTQKIKRNTFQLCGQRPVVIIH